MGESGLNDRIAEINAHFVSRSGLVMRALIDRSGRVIEANTLFESIFGPGDEVAELATLIDGSSWADILAEPVSVPLSLESKTTEAAFVGRLYPAGDNTQLLLGVHAAQDQLLSRMSADFASITFAARQERRQLASKEEQTRRISELDPLTELPNRRYLADRIEEIGPDGVVSVAMIDIDEFKTINDTHGHGVGDAAIIGVADTLRSRCRPTDFAARFGGDEFVVLFLETTVVDAISAAERIRSAVEESNILPDGAAITLSIGVAESRAGERVGETLDRADLALYRAKEAGRNRVAV